MVKKKCLDNRDLPTASWQHWEKAVVICLIIWATTGITTITSAERVRGLF